MEILKPLRLKRQYYGKLENEINEIFYHLIFRLPMASLTPFGAKELRNANSVGIVDAMERGTIWFHEGKFYGNFNALISRQFRGLGGEFDAQQNMVFNPDPC